jgi:hypothetical protein
MTELLPVPTIGAAWDAEYQNLRTVVAEDQARISGLEARMTAAEIVNASQAATLAAHAAALTAHGDELTDIRSDLLGIEQRVTAIENAAPGTSGVSGWIRVDEDYTGTDSQRLAAARLDAISTGKGLLLRPRTWQPTAALPLWQGYCINVDADPGPNLNMQPPVVAKVVASNISGGAWLTVPSDLNGGYLGNISFEGGTTTRLIRDAGGILYGHQMESISLYGGAGGLGNDTEALTSTQGYFTGHWQVHGFRQTPIRLIGADNQFGWYLNIDSPPDVAGNGRPNLWFEVEKSWGVGPYTTGRNGWVPARFSGNIDRQQLSLFGGVYEGYKANSPTLTAAIELKGGVVFLDGPNIGHVAPPAQGMIVQDSANSHLILGPAGVKFADGYLTLPLLYQTAGTADIQTVPAGFGEGARRPVPVRLKDGATTQLVLANRLP